MSMGLIYTTNPGFNFPRSYISGFVGSAGDSNFAIAGNIVTFDYLYPVYHISCVIKTNFVTPNSNVYSLDYIIDGAASQVYQNGTPIAAAIGVGFYAMQTEPTWRIQLHSNFLVDEILLANLVPVANYWRPIS